MFQIKCGKYIISIVLLFLLVVPILAQSNKSALYNQGGLTITRNKATYKGRVIYDSVKEQKEEKVFEGEGEVVYLYTPLSLVGHYFSYQRYFYQYSGSDGSKPTSSYCFETVNLRSNTKVSILDLVDEVSLVAALKKDPWVREHAQGNLAQLGSCKTFDEVIQLQVTDDGFSNNFDVKSFAFLNYDPKTGLVAIRLLRNDYMGFNHKTILQLGLWVKPKPELKTLLDLRANFYYGKYKETQLRSGLGE